MTTHYHWIVFAYDRSDGSNFFGNTTLDLIALNQPSAILKAEELMPDKKYFVSQVIEHIDGQPCGHS